MRKIKPEFKRKSFGQHFLIDQSVIQKIVKKTMSFVDETKADHLIEIGPGKGAITFPLLDQLNKKEIDFTLIEKDREFVEAWNKRTEKFEIIEADFLHLKETDWLKSNKTVVVSNLPYSASALILLKLVEQVSSVSAMVLMFQKEVADRVIATQKDSSFGRLSLICQNEWEVRPVCSVPPRAFKPAPKVNSEVICLTPRKAPLISQAVTHRKEWEKLTKICFMHRRKTIKNNLNSNREWLKALEISQIDDKKRAEALSWQEWETLLKAFIK